MKQLNKKALVRLSEAIEVLEAIGPALSPIVDTLKDIRSHSSLQEEVRFIEHIKDCTYMVAKDHLEDARVYQTAGYDTDRSWTWEECPFSYEERIELIKEVLNQLPHFEKHDRRKGIVIRELLKQGK